MNQPSVREKLARHPFVQGLDSRALDRMAALAKEARFDADQIIFREGDECAEFYLVNRGRVAIEIAEQGQTLRIQTVGEGDEFGWSALIMASGKHFQARALQPVEALAFDGAQLFNAAKEDTAFGFELMTRLVRLVAERLHATRLQLHDVYSPAAKRAGA